MKLRSKHKRLLIWAVSIAVVALLIARIQLPSLVKGYVNRSINRTASYQGQVEDIDLALWRGAYTLKRVTIQKVDTPDELPFFEADQIDISLEWKALVDGALVGEVYFLRPVLRFVKDEKEPQLGDDGSWAETLQSLVPIELNRVEAVEGEVSYRGERELAMPDIEITNFHLLARNITNAESDARELPSALEASGSVVNGALLSVRGRFNLLMEEPAMDASLTCETIDLVELNPFLRRKVALDVKSGRLDVYGEWAIANSKLDGYLKLIAQDVEIFDLEEDSSNPLELAWQALAGLFVQMTENQARNQFATRIPFQGDIGNVDTGLMASIVSMLENAFVQAMKRDVDQTIDISEVEESDEPD